MKNFTENDVLTVAKRLNNARRNYLLVNPLQGKHLPTKPSLALEMMDVLGKKVAKNSNSRLVIGFAETATAIGAVVAKNLSDNCVFLPTTRENYSGTFVEFMEEHSHAPKQKIFAENLAKLLQTPEIVFVDDEFSTGKTLLNIIRQLKAKFPVINGKKICAASIINRLSAENLKKLADENVFCVSLVKLDKNFDADKFSVTEAKNVAPNENFTVYTRNSVKNPRFGVKIGDYFRQCNDIGDFVVEIVRREQISGEILVLGTEECMLPAILTGFRLEKANFSVFTHSTTRSPIGIGRDENYPIRDGFKLKSCYDSARTTFIYNLRRYDAAIIVTDAENFSCGLTDLVSALKIHGVEKIFCVRC